MRKLFNACNIFAAIPCLFALLFVILYATNVNSVGYFQGIQAPNVVLCSVLVIVFTLLIVARSFVSLDGVAGKALNVVVYALKAVIPVLLIVGALSLLQARLDGIGYIFFSNVDVQKEVATPENVGSAVLAIVAIAFGLVGTVFGILSAFFLPKDQEEKAEVTVAE